MPKKRGKLQQALENERREIERQKKLQEEREKNVEQINLEARQQLLRVAIIDESVKTFDNLLKTVYEYMDQIREIKDCENCVNTEIPGEVRAFMFRWMRNFSEHWDQQYNWWLDCDDRCLLTQNHRDDVRRITAKRCREPTAKFYDQKLRELMIIYNSLCDVLRKKMNQHHGDLITIRDEFRKKFLDILEVLSFDVVRHIDREMMSLNALSARYSFIGQDFIKFVWSFKDVPLPDTHKKLKNITMDPIPLTVTISNLIDLDSTVVEGLWFRYDFFSDYCPTYSLSLDVPLTDFSVEWKIRESMVEARLEEMKKERQEYEIKKEAQRLAEENAPKDKNKNKSQDDKQQKSKKKNSKKNQEFEPPIVDETTYVSVDDEYIAYEDEIVEKEREIYSPSFLGLAPHEVNLREFQIINGVFKVECFERPLQTKEINPRMFIRLNEKPNVLKRKEFHHIYQEPDIEALKKLRKSVAGRSLSVKLTEARGSALSDLVKVEYKLSDKFFWFGSPEICRWEIWEESEEFKKLDQPMQDYNINYEELKRKKREKLFSAPDPQLYKKKIEMKNFDLTTLTPPGGILLGDLMKYYIVPTMPIEFQYFTEQLEIFEQKQREWRDILNQKRELEETPDIASTSQINDTFRETLKGFDISTVTVDDYNKIFDMRHMKPRNMFVQNQREMIEVLTSSGFMGKVKWNREEFKDQQPLTKDLEDIDVGESRPYKNEPLALSELLMQIRKVQDSLKPFFKAVQDKTLFQSIHFDNKKIKVEDDGKAKKKLKFRRPSRSSKRLFGLGSIRKSTLARRSQTSQTASVDESSTNTHDSLSDYSLKLIPHAKGKWSTRDIFKQSFDAATKTVTFYTGALGIFGVAVRKYSNLPLRRWEMLPLIDGKSRNVLFKVEAQHISIEFRVSNDGYTFVITHPKKVPFSGIEKPVKLRQLKQILKSLNLDIFPEDDAGWYVNNNCEKHKVMELHTYKIMALYCLSHHFTWSVWNRWAHRRVAVFESRMIDKKTFQCLTVTPLRASFMDVRERCTDLDEVELDYILNPLDQEFHPDIFYLLKAEIETKSFKKNIENFMLIWFVQKLLVSLRPFSFSQ